MRTIAILMLAVNFAAGPLIAEQPSDGDRRALQAVQWIVGDWRGVGQPRRGSRQGAWQEQCEWIWDFAAAGAALTVQAKAGKFWQAGTLKPTEAPSHFTFEIQATDDQPARAQIYRGKLGEDGRLVFLNPDAAPEAPARITFRSVAQGDRLLVLFERRSAADRYSRLAEVGYTRKGSGFGQGTGFIECVVTGGLGTIAVTYEGQTYYVCCSGCRDYFNDDPLEVLTEYRARKAREAREKEQRP